MDKIRIRGNRPLAGKITIVLEPSARDWLAEKGWDPAYGARPLKRVIQKAVQDPLAELILSGGVKDGDRVVISPPAGKEAIRRLGRYRTGLVSGWAQDPDFRRLFGADCAFPLSDHCDFDELLEVIRRSGADKVYTVHGFPAEFAKHLRKRGVRAHALQATEQLAFVL